MSRKEVTVEIAMESYIAHPYWPEREQLIQIQLLSGINRLKNDDKKLAALKGQLEKDGLTMADYENLKVRAARQWYRVDPEDEISEIVIPRHQIAGCLVETINRTPKALHGVYNADSFRHVVRISWFLTGRNKADGVFRRYVKLDTSNKRSLQENEVLEHFTAAGTLSVPTDTKLDALKRFLSYAFDEIGLGAARKMGYGRGALLTCDWR